MDVFVFVAIFWLVILALVLVVFWVGGHASRGFPTTRLRSVATWHVRGELSEQMEFDLRLTYKRFKEIYPFSQITYQEYKQLQMSRAFRRAIGSEKNKRMVR